MVWTLRLQIELSIHTFYLNEPNNIIKILLILQDRSPLKKQRPLVKDWQRPIISTKVSWPWVVVSVTFAEIINTYPSATQLWQKCWEVNHKTFFKETSKITCQNFFLIVPTLHHTNVAHTYLWGIFPYVSNIKLIFVCLFLHKRQLIRLFIAFYVVACFVFKYPFFLYFVFTIK